MSIKPEGVTKADWAVYQKVLSIVNTIKRSKRKTEFPREHYQAIANKRWAKQKAREE